MKLMLSLLIALTAIAAVDGWKPLTMAFEGYKTLQPTLSQAQKAAEGR
jgi:hypothetical protein